MVVADQGLLTANAFTDDVEMVHRPQSAFNPLSVTLLGLSIHQPPSPQLEIAFLDEIRLSSLQSPLTSQLEDTDQHETGSVVDLSILEGLVNPILTRQLGIFSRIIGAEAHEEDRAAFVTADTLEDADESTTGSSIDLDGLEVLANLLLTEHLGLFDRVINAEEGEEDRADFVTADASVTTAPFLAGRYYDMIQDDEQEVRFLSTTTYLGFPIPTALAPAGHLEQASSRTVSYHDGSRSDRH